jgi:hypothetical protein
MLKSIILFIVYSVLVTACSDGSQNYPSPDGISPPYILKEDCKFTIVGELGRSSVTSPKATGVDDSEVSVGISYKDISISVSDCKIISNSHSLQIYEN